VTLAPERARIYEGSRIPSPVPTILHVPPGAEDILQVALDVDGTPNDGTSIRLGSEGRTPTGDRIPLDARLDSAVPPPCPPPESGVRVCLWRYPASLTATGSPAVNDAATRERLRALGYAQ